MPQYRDSCPVAVQCCDVRKHYGSGRSKQDVLCGLDMNVPYGAIYGLLGASGCGKTTLLKCIVGRTNVHGGYVSTLGRTPGTSGHLVPGRMVGYMPQETALFVRFTIGETLTFFGRLHGMSSDAIRERTDFLLSFLTLPEKSRLIGQLSGGQQRRVSLAAALLQEPELLILDEPTVGVDPVLREKIWEHLLDIAKSSLKTTIIITTHYIEEAALADRVGLMRGGRLLAEDKPSTLMSTYKLQNLEAVFLHLCHRDRLPNEDDEELLPSISLPSASDQESVKVQYKRPDSDSTGDSVLLLGGNKSTTYGSLKTPRDLTRGGCEGRIHLPIKTSYTYSGYEDCVVPGSPLSKSRRFRKMAMLPRARNLYALCVKNLTSMKRNIPILLFEFMVPVIQIVLFCVCIGREPRQIPVSIVNQDVDDLGGLFIGFLNNETMNKVAEPVYGTFEPSFTDFMASGLIVSATFFLATGLTTLSFVLERKEGLLERMYVAGVSALEIMMSHVLTQLTVMLGQILLMLGIALLGFQVGMVISACCRSEMASIQGTLGTMYPALLTSDIVFLFVYLISSFKTLFFFVYFMSSIQILFFLSYIIPGIIWPIEAMPNWMMKISYFLPMTYPTYAVRSIMGRGWSIQDSLVWMSYLISIAWIVIHSVVAGVLIHFQSD
ncbi:ABC transporter G family member 20-like [Aplysia californica]|uniref:ABC transporter G family member 20-like n=1 Tax=Aplysia californica TaxID=6500 RepID=A0ABM1A8G7_APLCA|nr:ABC transporter G family member 20-like [Aplysia californica]